MVHAVNAMKPNTKAHYVSDSLATSASFFAEVGHERNGVFFS